MRGPIEHVRSDRGNFTGACKDLKIPSNIDSTTVQTYLPNQGCNWTFNPPHASHCVGAWERTIGLANLLSACDFMAEVAGIIYARPLVSVTTDPEDSFILSPAALLTQKVNVVSLPLVNLELQISTSLSGNRFNICPTPSWTNVVLLLYCCSFQGQSETAK